MDLNLTLSNRQIVPAVTNMFQFENQTTTLNFVLDSYMWENSDLRNYIPYAITSINGVIDMTELTATYNENTDKLTVSWTVGEYTLSEKGAVLYQIVFKENKLDGEIGEEDINNAVWYSYKAVIINRSSIDSDNHITANYPTILKQWLDRMNSMEDGLIKVKDSAIEQVEDTRDEAIEDINDLAAKFDTSVVYIPYGETIAVEDRLSNRLYYQYTDEAQTRGRFEDSEGVILNLDPTGYVTHIGQTIFSLLPIDNAGLHLLDGTKLLGDGAYSDFVEYVAKLYEKSLNCFCTEDEWQQSVTNYGVCGKFVYDSTENSVRLPKVTGFVEGTIDPYALGNLVEAGLPNITGKFEAKGFNSDFGTINYGSGAFDVKVAAGYDETANAGSNNLVNTDVAEFDASKSNDIYGNANTVQPQAIKGYYYMVIATSDIEKVGINGQSGTFLNHSQITNCLIEVPQRINYTLENNRLTIKTGSVMIVPYGTEDLTAQHPVGSAFLHENFKVYDTQFADGKFFVLVETREDLKNKYSAETSTSHVFVSVNLGYGLTAGEVTSNTSGDTDTGTGTYRFWYDTANNLVKKFESDPANPVEDVFALPIMVAKSEVSVGWKSVDQVFNGFGYIGSTIWVDKNVKGLIPDGRNIDGTLKNIEYVTSKVIVRNDMGINANYEFALHFNNYFNYGVYSLGNDNYLSSGYGSKLKEFVCGTFSTDSSGKITSFNPKTTFRAFDQNDFEDNFVHKTGDEEIGGHKTFTNEIIANADVSSATNYGQLRLIQGKYGVILRNDGNALYFLPTKENDQYGTWDETKIGCSLQFGDGYFESKPSDKVHSVITTTGISKSSNAIGLKLGNGIIINSLIINSQGTTYTWKIPFTTTEYVVVTTSCSGLKNFTRTTTTISCNDFHHGETSKPSDVMAIAIGY